MNIILFLLIGWIILNVGEVLRSYGLDRKDFKKDLLIANILYFIVVIYVILRWYVFNETI